MYGASLLVVAELVFWSIERTDAVAGTPGAPWRRMRDICVLGGGGSGAGCCVLLGAEVRVLLPVGGWRLEVGALAAVLALGLIVWAAWRRPARREVPGSGGDQAGTREARR